MPGRSATTYDILTKTLGYSFADPKLLRLALTHSSARVRRQKVHDNERLEFLGDRVLGLCIAELLCERFPGADEGELALRFNTLVRKETCAAVADDDWDLGQHVIMSGGEAINGGRRKLTILGNTCEAVLGAIFLDSGYSGACEVIRRFWVPRLAGGSVAPTDAKTALQEWAQGEGLALPVYNEVSRSGPDHAPHFTVEVRVEGVAPSQGEGANKRLAEQASANAMLVREGIWREPKPDIRCGVIALIGAPNAGKSTLLNQLVGAKVAIVTHKVQTTRARLRGIAIEGTSQLILVDTPGIFKPRRRLDRAMVDAAWRGSADADITLLLIDAARKPGEEEERILDRIRKGGALTALVLNKIDQVPKETLLALAGNISARADFDRIFMISALTGDGVPELRAYLGETVPQGPWLFPEDQISDAPLRSAAAEVTREKLYLRLHEELPYASTVETTSWKVLKSGDIRIEQTVFVERESQRKIVLGKSGQTIKKISMEARKEIAEIAGALVHLFLFVKVRPKWGDDPERYREIGLEFPKG